MTSRHYTGSATPDATKRYASDLNDREFALIARYVAQKSGSGKKRTVDIREVLNAIFYRVRTGCQWRMLPSDFPAWYHVWYYYRRWWNDAPSTASTRCYVEKSAARQVVIQNQPLVVLIVKVFKQQKWVVRKASTQPNM